nr:hypothetical protein [Haliscomenobacter sp.]
MKKLMYRDRLSFTVIPDHLVTAQFDVVPSQCRLSRKVWAKVINQNVDQFDTSSNVVFGLFKVGREINPGIVHNYCGGLNLR